MADTVMMRYLLMILAAGLIMASASSQAADPNRPSGYETPSLEGARDAADLGAAEQASIRHVIASQLAAFQHDDALEAFSYASPGIQRRFANPENFMAMVKSGYRPVYRPLEVEFRDIRMLHGRPAQVIDIVGPDGQPMIAIYLMEQQPDGSWRIDGVYFLKKPEAAA